MRGCIHGRSIRCAGLAVLLMVSGCAIEHPGLNASSGGMPWFNFQVAPSKKDAKNYHRSISRDPATTVEFKPAVATQARHARLWPTLRLPGQKTESLTLPRTDDVTGDSSKPIAVANQADHIQFD